MNTFKFRAECRFDVARLLEVLPGEFELSAQSAGVLGVQARVSTRLDLGEFRLLISSIPDSHKMLETLTHDDA